MQIPAPSSPVVLLSGASGLIGSLVLQRLLAARDCSVIAPVRRALAASDPRLTDLVGDFTDPAAQLALREQLRGVAGLQVWICALGTTLKAAGSREAFRSVDLGLVLDMAALARHSGARHAIVVSSVGADPAARHFYLSVKGRAEQGLREIGFARLDLLRPSLLLGTRLEARRGEAWGQRLAPLLNPLLPGPWRRYRAIHADTVAAAILRLRDETATGCFVHEYDSLSG